MRVTITAVNAAIKAAGGDEELVKGNGYFYFVGAETPLWAQASVYTTRLGDLTVDEWVDEWRELKERRQ
jgi:hypothetical protein